MYLNTLKVLNKILLVLVILINTNAFSVQKYEDCKLNDLAFLINR